VFSKINKKVNLLVNEGLWWHHDARHNDKNSLRRLNISHSKKDSATCYRNVNVRSSPCTVGLSVCLSVCLLLSSDFKESWIFYIDFLFKLLFMKLILWEPNCSMRRDGWTDEHDEANIRFSQFEERTQI
jgi:hypothetical protein